MAHQTCLYRWFNNSELLYVGITNNVWERFKSHRHTKEWATTEATNITIQRFNSRELALEAEKTAIINEKPKYNVVYNGYQISESDKVVELPVKNKNISDNDYSILRKELQRTSRRGPCSNNLPFTLNRLSIQHCDNFLFEYNNVFVLYSMIHIELKKLCQKVNKKDTSGTYNALNTISVMLCNWYEIVSNLTEQTNPNIVNINFEKLIYMIDGKDMNIFEILLTAYDTNIEKHIRDCCCPRHFDDPQKSTTFEINIGDMFEKCFLRVKKINTTHTENKMFIGLKLEDIDRCIVLAEEKTLNLLAYTLKDISNHIKEFKPI